VSSPVEFDPAVQGEIGDAVRWYEQRRTGLGRDFLDADGLVVTSIALHPERFGFALDDIREGVVGGFPYADYYRVLADRIRVLAAYHTSRNPSVWQSRS